jgi:hypothetical protein
MSRIGPTETELEDRFFECLKGTGRGLPYGRIVATYASRFKRTDRTAKTHLKRLNEGMAAGRVSSVSRYKGPEGWLYGTPEDDAFVQAKEDAERPPAIDRPDSIFHLGGHYQHSPMGLEWTNCPFTNRIVRTQVVTLGIADFMVCPVCSRYHFLGVSPKMQDQRVYAWQIDPLVNAEEYADELTVSHIGNPKTFKPQKTRIDRIRNGGHYVGLRYRSSWDHDPMNPSDTREARIHGVFAQVPVRVLSPDLEKYPTSVRYLPPRPPKVRPRPRKKRTG